MSMTVWIESGCHDAFAAAAGQMRDEFGLRYQRRTGQGVLTCAFSGSPNGI